MKIFKPLLMIVVLLVFSSTTILAQVSNWRDRSRFSSCIYTSVGVVLGQKGSVMKLSDVFSYTFPCNLELQLPLELGLRWNPAAKVIQNSFFKTGCYLAYNFEKGLTIAAGNRFGLYASDYKEFDSVLQLLWRLPLKSRLGLEINYNAPLRSFKEGYWGCLAIICVPLF